ncbi:MAG: hypothetical protein J1F63_05875 [Oscillospiraceae bacterium]|nr:hypothetical protein [Oscillospiraceae bacterium]
MKTKKILALLVALAMVMAVVPGLGMAASAEDGDTVEVGGLTYAVVGDNLVPDGGFEDADGNFSWGTWESPNGSNGYFKDNCSDWFYKVNRDTNEAQLYPADGMVADDYALGSRWNDGTLGLCSLANYIPVTPGTYYVAFDYKHKTGSGTDFIQTSFKNNRDDYNSPSDVFKPAAATTEWQTAETIMEVTEDGYVYFHFRWLGVDGNPGNGPYWYFDNFVVEEVELVPVSTESTVKAALDALEVPAMAKAEIELPGEAVDAFETELTVTWESGNPDVIAEDGTVTPTDKVETVALTPSAEFKGKTVTGAAKNVTVFPAPLAGGTYNGAEVGKTNLIAGFENGWSDGTGAALAESAGLTVEKEGDVTYVKTNGSGGIGSANSLHGEFDVLKPGVTYLMAVTAKDFTPSWVGTDFGDGEKVQQNNNSIFENVAVNEWRRVTATFTAASTTLKIASRWNNSSFESFELYELTAPDSEDIVAALNAIEIDAMSKGAAIELTETVTVEEEDLAVTWYTSDAAVVAADGTVTQADEVKTAALTPAVNVDGVNVTGAAKTVVVFPTTIAGTEVATADAVYTVGEEPIFETSELKDGTGAAFDESTGWDKVEVGDVTYYSANGNNTTSSDKGTNMAFAVEANTNYAVALTYKGNGGRVQNGTGWQNDAQTLVKFDTKNDWGRDVKVFNSGDFEELHLMFGWLGSNCSIESIEIYALDQEDEDLVKVELESVDLATGEDVNTVLPTQADGTFSLGSVRPVSLEWNIDGLEFINIEESEPVKVTVPGVATYEDKTLDVTIDVNVYYVYNVEGEIVNVNGQSAASANAVKFPASTNSITAEFDVTLDEVGDLFILINDSAKNSGNLFGASTQIGLGFNSTTGGIAPIDGNGTGGRKGASDVVQYVPEELGETYHFVVNTNIITKTYSLVVTNEAGEEIVNVSDFGYRGNSDRLDSVLVFTNNGKGKITVSNLSITYAVPDVVTVNYVTVAGGEPIASVKKLASVGDEITIEALGSFYADGKIYNIPETTVTVEEAVIEIVADVAHDYAATKVAYYDGGASTDLYGYVAVAGAQKIPAVDENGLPMVTGSVNNYGSERRMSMTIAVPTLKDGESAVLNIAAGAVRDNNGSTTGGAVRIRADYNGTYGYSTAWTDTEGGDGGTKLPAELIYGTADITNIVKAANAAGEETITLLLQVYQGGVGLINEAQSAFGGVAQGYASYISVVETAAAELPAIDVQLGFANDAFTIDFLFGEALEGDYSIKIETKDGQVYGAAVDGEGVSFATAYTNAEFKATLIGNVDGAAVKSAQTEAVAIYSLVVDAIVNFADEAITEDQLAAAVKVLNAGGIYIINDNGTKSLTKEAQKIMKLEGETITLNAEVAALGLKFVEGVKAQVGENDVDVVVTDTTITIAGLEAMEEAVIYLEDVEFVLEAAESAADEAVSGELDFVEEV